MNELLKTFRMVAITNKRERIRNQRQMPGITKKEMGTDQLIKKITMTRFSGREYLSVKDAVIDETVFRIVPDSCRPIEMVASMIHLRELAAGFLFTQGIVQKASELLRIDADPDAGTCRVHLADKALQRLTDFQDTGQVRGSSGGSLLSCPGPGIRHPEQDKSFSVYPSIISRLINAHADHSILFKKTGALHSAALCSTSGITSFFEDIGRHNAVDKLAGHIFLEGIETGHSIATLSCRMSVEIIGKIIKTGIPVVISNAAPTLAAVRLAREAGLTLVGFARGKQFNVYSHAQRINQEMASPCSTAFRFSPE